jgi:glycosyltransferase involved in cell wall biosynthesis
MPTYNRATFIGQALESLAGQTVPPYEILVIDDRSTDDTRAVVEKHPLRPRYHLQDRNGGASVARNHGVALAHGEVIVFLDSDDILLPNHHAAMLEILDASPGVGLVGCDSHMIGPRDERLYEETWTSVQSRIKSFPIQSGIRSFSQIFLFSTPFPGMTVRREVYQAVGGLDQALFPLDDYDLQLRVAASGALVHYEHRPLALYRVHGANESGPERSVRVGTMKLKCLARARRDSLELRGLGVRARRRIGEVRRELAIALLRTGAWSMGTMILALSFLEDPAGLRDIFGIVRRRFTRRRSGALAPNSGST